MDEKQAAFKRLTLLKDVLVEHLKHLSSIITTQ